MISDAEKSVYDQVVYDSDIERSFADQMEKKHGGQGVRQAAGMVRGADAAWQLQPGLGRAS